MFLCHAARQNSIHAALKAPRVTSHHWLHMITANKQDRCSKNRGFAVPLSSRCHCVAFCAARLYNGTKERLATRHKRTDRRAFKRHKVKQLSEFLATTSETLMEKLLCPLSALIPVALLNNLMQGDAREGVWANTRALSLSLCSTKQLALMGMWP